MDQESSTLAASFGIGDTDAWIGDWLGAITFFSNYPQQETVSLVTEVGFRIEEETVEKALENGVEASFLWITARVLK